MASPKGVAGLTETLKRATHFSARAALICLATASVGLPIAWISLAKVLVIFVGLGVLIANLWAGRTESALAGSATVKVILVALVGFFVSLLWTQIGIDVAALALVKHAKLLVIPLLILLITNYREARLGVIAFAAAQIFVLLSSLLLAIDVPIWWVTDPIGKNVVFSSYLDQSIMFSTTAAMLWHLRGERLWPVWFAAAASTIFLMNVLLLLDGRTGYAVAITMLTLSVMWAVPRRMRLSALLVTPALVLIIMYMGSSHIQNRISPIVTESSQFSQKVETNSSSGWRLNAWHRSIQGIQEAPWYGHGVGSWAITVKRIEGAGAIEVFGEGDASNPHQEYLLWGVELGILGTLLYVMILLAIALDANHFKPPVQKAVWSVLAALAVASLFNSTLYDDLIGDFFCVTLGVLLAMGFRDLQEQKEVKP
jgi:O-antigen ligase